MIKARSRFPAAASSCDCSSQLHARCTRILVGLSGNRCLWGFQRRRRSRTEGEASGRDGGGTDISISGTAGINAGIQNDRYSMAARRRVFNFSYPLFGGVCWRSPLLCAQVWCLSVRLGNVNSPRARHSLSVVACENSTSRCRGPIGKRAEPSGRRRLATGADRKIHDKPRLVSNARVSCRLMTAGVDWRPCSAGGVQTMLKKAPRHGCETVRLGQVGWTRTRLDAVILSARHAHEFTP